ncbi:MAG: phage tail protein [Paenibacillaceae bacterium]|jgi:uncharacterized phage protein gp47/JayE|nr:phage tail protein [Paenibacillaceae bacterium]
MYEGLTYELILQRMLSRVSADIDKREGSVIYDALAPAAAELAQLYGELDLNLNLSYADTATGERLERRTREFGIAREPATKARRKGAFYASGSVLMDVPIGSRFSGGGLTYISVEKLMTGMFVLECETAGTVGNSYFGPLLPIDYIQGLTVAQLTDVLVPGEDVETDGVLRARYFTALSEQPFGGNVSDYKQKIGAIDGVGGVKVFPAWQGGGTVKATIIGSDYNPPSMLLVEEVQTRIDPTVNSGEGLGLAPIGHQVTIVGVASTVINMETTLQLAAGVTVGQLQPEIEEAVGAYLLSLRQSWAAEEAPIVIRVSQIEARILGVSGVADISGTQLNGGASNVTLTSEQIPAMGTVTLNG